MEKDANIKIINIDSVCRFCADINTKLYSIFENHLEEKVKCCIPIPVFKGDGLPSMICALCKYKLNTAYEFRLLALAIDRKMRELLSNEENLPNINTPEITDFEQVQKYNCTEDSDNNSKNKSTKTELNISDIKDIIEDRKRDEYFQTQTEIKVKRRRHKLNGRALVVCMECGKSVQRHCFRDHMKTHTRIADCKCVVCGELFLTRSRLWQHKKSVHSAKKEPVNCDQCGKNFSSNSVYHVHYRNVHLKEKNYQCYICNRSFGAPKTLKTHMQTHTGERPYICEHCGKGLSTSYALKQHIRLHTNETPFKCTECEKGFKQKVTLTLHYRRLHLGVTPEDEKLSKIDEASSTCEDNI